MPIVLVTGATAGFGRAIALKFAENGYDVIITGRREERLISLKNEIETQYKRKVISLCFDVRNSDDVSTALNSLSGAWKKVDVLVNNAGLAQGLSTIQEGNLDDWNTMIDTNVKGLLYVSRIVLPWLIENGKGHVINIGSVAGKYAYPKGNVYCASKHAVDAISKSMRIDMLPYGIRVTAINPGAAETEFSLVRFKGDEERAKQAYLGYVPLSADDIADIAWFAASRPAHVVLNDIIVTPLAQASPAYMHKNNQ
jgi:3-hydroxy acid dehydrogenase / malonic semialdehyde reductase